MLLEQQRWHVDQYEAIIEDITADTVQSFFATRLFARVAINAYATGNLDQEKTMGLLAQVQKTLFDAERLHAKTLFAAQWPQRRVQQVPQGQGVLVSEVGSNEGNNNSAAIVLFQVGVRAGNGCASVWVNPCITSIPPAHEIPHRWAPMISTPSCCLICSCTLPSGMRFTSCAQWSSWGTL